MQLVDGLFYSCQLTVGGVKSSDYIDVIICNSSKKITSYRAENCSHITEMFPPGFSEYICMYQKYFVMKSSFYRLKCFFLSC